MDNLNDGIRVVLYCRIACDSFEYRNSLDFQEQKLRKYAEGKGYHVVCCLKEQAGWLTLDREKLNAVKNMDRNTMDRLLIADISRIGRDGVQTGRFIQSLRKKGIKIETPDGILGGERDPAIEKLLELMDKRRKDKKARTEKAEAGDIYV